MANTLGKSANILPVVSKSVLPGSNVVYRDVYANVNHFNELKSACMKNIGNTLTTDQLLSTLGRIIGRTVHCCAINDIFRCSMAKLINIAKGDMTACIKTDIPASGEFRGVGFGEVPRGMLSHWVVIKDGRIENYQAVVPSTWNAGPRNEQDKWALMVFHYWYTGGRSN